MTLEVGNLLSPAMLDVLGLGSENSPPSRPNPVVVLTPPPHKLKELLQPVDTSSQASAQEEAEMAETSLEGVPTTISPIAVTTRSENITPPADTAKLWENTNQALEELLTMKASIYTCRQSAVWELGMEFVEMSPRQLNLLKKPTPLVPMLSRMLRPVFHYCQEGKGHLHPNHPRSQDHPSLHHLGG